MGCITFAVDFQTIGIMKADKIITLAAKQATHIATRGLFLLLVVMFAECEVAQDDNQKTSEEDFCITGTWELNELRFLSGQRVDVQTGNEYLWYRISTGAIKSR